MVLTPEDLSLEPGDWQWGEQSRTLVRLLRAYDLDVRQQGRPPEAGDKGLASEIILALGASGTVGAATTVLLNWLTARSTRRLTLTVGEGADGRTVQVVGEGLSDSSMRAALIAVLGRPETTDDARGDTPAELPPGE
ncbi:effector-associated constant component EACC1 [Micromonospora sp. DT53]|uniref:effector-associated constant component EACC1 n=1 Tax=Micromonospora sp. DT53 TaxID=3393444 RepID=UPI003CF87408